MRSPLFASLVTFAFLLIKGNPSYTQVQGCTDSLANNYNSAATVNNGSCTYNMTGYTPLVKVNPVNNILTESSGLQMAGNFLWSFNDGGGAAAIYRIDTVSNALLQTVNLDNATNVDWEDISFDGTYFYIGDFGNNANGARTDLKIYKFALNEIPDYTTNPVVTIPMAKIEIISFTYKDHPTPLATSINNTKYDCEAMIVDEGKIHLFTKNWINLNTTHYVINATTAGSYIADSLETLTTNYLVTGADKTPGQQVVTFIGYQASGTGSHFLHILSDYRGGKYFNGNKRMLDLPDASAMGQAEGIAFRNDRYGYISNEKIAYGPFTISAKLQSFNISNYVNVPSHSLSLSFVSVSAWQQNAGVQVHWQVSAEAIKGFEVQKSKDGKQFIKAASLSASDVDAANTYNWFDANPFKGRNYYRIKSIEKSGDIKYSTIINVQVSSSTDNIYAYPNPVSDKNFTVRLINRNKGNYTLRLFNDVGQQVYTKTIVHEGGSSSQTVHLNATIPKGVYQLQVSNGENTTTKSIICE